VKREVGKWNSNIKHSLQDLEDLLQKVCDDEPVENFEDGISIYYILKYSFTLCIFVGFGMLKKKENKDRANVSSRIPLSYLGTLRINLEGESSDDSGDNDSDDDDEIECK
jgi:hypothetical protein